MILDNIGKLVESIEYKSQLIGRKERLVCGVEKTRFKGILIGFIITLFIVGLPFISFYRGGF